LLTKGNYYFNKGLSGNRESNVKEARRWLSKASWSGDGKVQAVAQKTLSDLYSQEFCDYPAKAFFYARKSAELGYDEGMAKLAYCYEEGFGCTIDLPQAFGWFKKAQEIGHRHSIWKIGLMYSDGLGVEQDSKIALEWFKKAAENDIPIAYMKLGECYRGGIGCEKNEKEAIEWEAGFESKLKKSVGTSSGYQSHDFK
jgi:hypothetical protein